MYDSAMTAIATETSLPGPETAERILERLVEQLREKLPEGYDLDDECQVVRLDPDLPDRVAVRTVTGGWEWLPAPLSGRPASGKE